MSCCELLADNLHMNDWPSTTCHSGDCHEICQSTTNNKLIFTFCLGFFLINYSGCICCVCEIKKAIFKLSI
jgi:hypothetical protein